MLPTVIAYKALIHYQQKINYYGVVGSDMEGSIVVVEGYAVHISSVVHRVHVEVISVDQIQGNVQVHVSYDYNI